VEKVPCTSSGVAPIFVNANSSNSILIVKGANKFLSPEDIDRAADDLKKCQLIVLQLEVQLETVYHAEFSITLASTFKSGMSACVCVLGVAWLGDTFVKAHIADIQTVAGDLLHNYPWLLAVVLSKSLP
jgi:anaerobic C4-dicarboxylate transporter